MRRSERLLVALSVLGALGLPLSTSAEDKPEPGTRAQAPEVEVLEEAAELRGQANDELSASQERIESISDETDALLTKYQAALRRYDSLRTYNTQLETLLASQEEERMSLEEETGQIELVSRDVTPLMLRMIDALDAFVSLDVPFLEDERTERVLELRKLMQRADVTESEKYRRIMEAYQIENEYGRTVEAYRSTLDSDGKELTVNFLRVGRIALLYQTLDESSAGVWNQESRRWEPLDSSHRTAIREALRIARKQAAPDLIRIPLPSPQMGEG